MELKINTTKLKDMVIRAIKGASNNKLIPITSLMAVQLKSNTLTLITTDATNYLYIKEDKVEGEDFYVVVPVDVFSKLIARLTCESVTLTVKDNVLDVIGNGTYHIELLMDEEGEAIKYPDPVDSLKLPKAGKEIHASTIQTILTSIKPSLATTFETPCHTGYYVGDKIVGTDSYTIASLDIQLADEPMLISQELMNLLAVITSEKIDMVVKDDVIVFRSPDCVIYGTKMEGIEDFQIEDISAYLETDFKRMCKISKSGLLQVLDRLSLFVGTYDKNGVNLVFTKDGLQISSKSASGVEIINYTESKGFKSFAGMIDITLLATQIKAQISDVVTLYYGVEQAIKMTDGNLTQIVALMQDDEQ